MPTVLRVGPFRFFFCSADGTEPPHVHVEHDACEAKFWLDPARLESSHGYGAAEIRRIERLVDEHGEELLRAWNEFFGNTGTGGSGSGVGER